MHLLGRGSVVVLFSSSSLQIQYNRVWENIETDRKVTTFFYESNFETDICSSEIVFIRTSNFILISYKFILTV